MKTLEEPAVRKAFDIDAAQVLGALRTSIANVLATAGGVRKPADLQKSFKLDGTLSWQIFQISGMRGGENATLSRGANVPSRTSFKRFLEAARAHGIDSAKVERMWTDYERFEHLVDVHAGDRTSFNSMVAAVGSLDEEWDAANAQHLRNAYRSMSHLTGMQAKTKMITTICHPVGEGSRMDACLIVGYVGLRLLRAAEAVQVFGIRSTRPTVRETVNREPLNLNAEGDGYLLAEFATQPLPPLKMKELDAGWLVGVFEQPDVGNLGASTMHFGTVYRNHPLPGQNKVDKEFTADLAVDKPIEVLINDVIVKKGLMQGVKPSAEIFLGNNHSDSPALPGDLIPLLGNHHVDYLGAGPDVLATPDVPQYPDMVHASAKKLGWDISDYDVWRIRVEYPAYQSTVRMKWQLP